MGCCARFTLDARIAEMIGEENYRLSQYGNPMSQHPVHVREERMKAQEESAFTEANRNVPSQSCPSRKHGSSNSNTFDGGGVSA